MVLAKVEALEDGRIVLVSEEYALREGLTILRKIDEKQNIPVKPMDDPQVKRIQRAGSSSRVAKIDEFRKPLDWERNLVRNDLKPNFHWDIVKKRREKSMSRKTLAGMLGVDEDTVKLIENGLLPKDNFVLINKLQEALGLNLRLNKGSFSQTMRDLVDKQRIVHSEPKKDNKQDLKKSHSKEQSDKSIMGDDIELLEE